MSSDAKELLAHCHFDHERLRHTSHGDYFHLIFTKFYFVK